MFQLFLLFMVLIILYAARDLLGWLFLGLILFGGWVIKLPFRLAWWLITSPFVFLRWLIYEVIGWRIDWYDIEHMITGGDVSVRMAKLFIAVAVIGFLIHHYVK